MPNDSDPTIVLLHSRIHIIIFLHTPIGSARFDNAGHQISHCFDFFKVHCTESQDIQVLVSVLSLPPQYKYPLLFKVHYTPLYIYKRPTLAPAFATGKKSKENFHFQANRWKVKIVSALVLQRQCAPHPPPPKQEQHPPSSFSRLSISASSHESFELCLWASVLYLLLLLASVSKTYPKVTTSSLYTTSVAVNKRFKGGAQLSDGGEICYLFADQSFTSVFLWKTKSGHHLFSNSASRWPVALLYTDLQSTTLLFN